MYDLSLLKSFLNKETYTKYRNYVTEQDFDPDLAPILRGLDEWYKTNTKDATLEDLANLTFAGGVPEKKAAFLKEVFQNLQKVNGTETAIVLLDRLKTENLCQQLAMTAYEVSAGRKSVLDIYPLVEKLKQPTTETIEYVTDDIHKILNEIVATKGLRWRLDALNKSLGSLRRGDFGFVFARPETGKTTFLASEVSFMASQDLNNSGPILWFNNEEQGKKVKLRCYQAALGATIEQIRKYPDRAQEKYEKLTKNRIKIYDSASIHRRQVETICKTECPSLIIFDQIDKIKGFSDDREDLILGAIYQWARELSKTYAPVIGVCQADGSAEGIDRLTMAHVSNAKTAKQAEADFIIGIGKVHQSGYDNIRFFNISKNKLIGDADSDPTMRHAFFEAIIRPEIARYE
ncbi:MAG: AAA family ATPase [Thermoplasmatales archaeon]